MTPRWIKSSTRLVMTFGWLPRSFLWWRYLIASLQKRPRSVWMVEPSSMIVGSACGLLGEGGGRSLSLGDRALAERLGGLLVGVVVEHEGQALAHVPFEIIGEHAEEDVGAHAVFEPVVDRPDMEVDGLDRPDGVLDQA